jgi:hypothetical protein
LKNIIRETKHNQCKLQYNLMHADWVNWMNQVTR